MTVIVGENGTGKSTLLEGIAALAGYDDAGGGKGYRPVDHSSAVEIMGGQLGSAFRASWLPKVTSGWFFRAESFFSVSRYLDLAAREAGEAGRPTSVPLARRGISPLLRGALRQTGHLYPRRARNPPCPRRRQVEMLKILRRMQQSGICQVIMATHAPILMAAPDTDLLRLTKEGLAPAALQETDHFRLMRDFCSDPAGFVSERLQED